jgi:hypothetical protein
MAMLLWFINNTRGKTKLFEKQTTPAGFQKKMFRK